MGRWAQRQRGGGGLNTPIVAVLAELIDIDTVIVSFNKAVTAALFSASDFVSNPSGEPGDTVSQFTANALTIDFLVDISADTSITFSGTVANVTSPFTLNY